MKRLFLARILPALLVLSTLFAFASCGRISLVKLPENLVASFQRREAAPLSEEEQLRREAILSDYGWKLYSELLSEAKPGENQLFSPLSLEFALCMVANGAKGETREEIERAIGLSVGELNETLCGILSRVENCKFGTMLLANSIWAKDDGSFTVNPAFLQAVADYYNAQVYKAPLDATTCDQLNAWVKKYTKGMIPHLLDSIDPSTVMLLVNVLTFDQKWETPYENSQVEKDQIFHNYDGGKATVTMLRSSETRYVEGYGFTGFIKSYEADYDILFLLPDEKLDVYAAMGALTNQKYVAIRLWRELSSQFPLPSASVKIPEFSYDCTYDDLIPAVASTGIERAFSDALADFSGLGESALGNVYIGMILQKTHIELDRNGTKAAAATVIGMKDAAMPPMDEREVILDRPFGYVIFDRTTGTPLFLGITATLGK